ncbi:MAG: chemotaxis protein CheW [Variovorax sp.]|nr:chemotaxis protein CheW [Variovorax sp.]
MANRDALRAFQARLASRLQAARTSDVSASWLAVEAGSARYLFPLGHAGEIFPWTTPHPVPYTEPWFLGVANLRGGLYGVVQLAGFASDAATPASLPVSGDGVRTQARLVALNELLEVNCALMVDRLVGLRGVEAFTASQPPAADSASWLGHTYTDAKGEQWQEIDLQALSRQPRFLSIGA